jgi:hypothetical protein
MLLAEWKKPSAEIPLPCAAPTSAHEIARNVSLFVGCSGSPTSADQPQEAGGLQQTLLSGTTGARGETFSV